MIKFYVIHEILKQSDNPFSYISMFLNFNAAVTYIDSSAVQALKDLHQEYKSRDIQVEYYSLLPHVVQEPYFRIIV